MCGCLPLPPNRGLDSIFPPDVTRVGDNGGNNSNGTSGKTGRLTVQQQTTSTPYEAQSVSAILALTVTATRLPSTLNESASSSKSTSRPLEIVRKIHKQQSRI